jgi:hypothetical protein
MSYSPLQYTIESNHQSEQPKIRRIDGITRFSPHSSVYLHVGALLVMVMVEGEPELWVVDTQLHPDPAGAIKEVYDYEESGWITQVIVLKATGQSRDFNNS